MHVSVRTLESQAVLTVSVDPLETIGAFKKRAAATLPYNGVCKFMLRVRMAGRLRCTLCRLETLTRWFCIFQGQYLSKHTSFESLELLPYEFLVSGLPRHTVIDLYFCCSIHGQVLTMISCFRLHFHWLASKSHRQLLLLSAVVHAMLRSVPKA